MPQKTAGQTGAALTYNAIVATLVAQGRLTRFPSDEGEDDDPRLPVRMLYATRDLIESVNGYLTKCKKDKGQLSPLEQALNAMSQYVYEDRPFCGDYVNVVPQNKGVYEIKAGDIRLFGFFAGPKLFIGCAVVMKNELKMVERSVADAIRCVERQRKASGLDFKRHKTNVMELL